jgi:RND family efflux transporter MFP subunit
VKKRERLIELETAGLGKEEAAMCVLVAPHDGTIDEVAVSKRQEVEMGQLLLWLQALAKLQIRAHIPQDKMPLIEQGQPASVLVEPKAVLKGQVESISGKADSLAQTFVVLVSISNPPADLRSGTFVRAEIIVGKERTVLVIPASAVNPDRQKCLVQGVDGGFEEWVVVVGPASWELVEVRSGLREGELVVLDWRKYLEKTKHE